MSTPAPPGAQPGPPFIPRPESGALAWILGFLAVLPIPFLSAVVACIVMAAVGRSQRRLGPSAAATGLRAANWGLTYLLITVVSALGHFLLLAVLTRDGPGTSFFPIGIPLTIWLAVSVVHFVFCGLGTARAVRRTPFAPPAIPFFR